MDPGATVACGQGCSGTQPVCCADATFATCAGYGECKQDSAAFECDDPSDCAPGYVCCASPGVGSKCAGICPATLLCATDTDCPVGTCTDAPKDIAPNGFKSCQ